MSQSVFDNSHLLKTLSDKRLSLSFRQELVKNLPEAAITALRETLFNVAVGNAEGFPSKTSELLTENRELVFKIIDSNDSLTESEREKLLLSRKALRFLPKVLPTILEELEAQRDE
jgi:hypothetical protein